MTTERQLKEIQHRVDAATEGPWAYEAVSEKSNDWCLGIVIGDDDKPLSGKVEHGEGVVDYAIVREAVGLHDAAFIAHAREDIPFLLEEILALRATITALKERATVGACAMCGLSVRQFDGIIEDERGLLHLTCAQTATITALTQEKAGLIRDFNSLLIDGAKWERRALAAEAHVTALTAENQVLKERLACTPEDTKKESAAQPLRADI